MLKTAIDKVTLMSILSKLRAELKEIYGDRLKKVYLYGSYAREEADAESDIDVLIVLVEYRRYAEEINRTSQLISSLSLKHGVSLSRLFVTQKKWQDDDSLFLRYARQEAVAA